MNKQEMYEKAFRGVMGQGCPGADAWACAYVFKSGDKELRCAVGHVVTDPMIYNADYLDDIVKWVLPKVDPSMTWGDVYKFMWDLRQAHDETYNRVLYEFGKRGFNNARFLELFKARMIKFAATEQLVVPPEFTT